MYTLTLTRGEREALDWIGGRYRHGDELGTLLWMDCTANPLDEWDGDMDITFHIPEHVAWTISEIIDADSLACLGTRLSRKLTDLQAKVV